MAMRRCLVATAILLLSISGAPACDDYPDDMALAAARRDAKLAQSAQPESTAQVATAAPSQSAQMGPAAAEATPPQPHTAANLAGALRQ